MTSLALPLGHDVGHQEMLRPPFKEVLAREISAPARQVDALGRDLGMRSAELVEFAPLLLA